MGKFILIGASDAHEGHERDYSAWYESTHMVDICALPGIKSGRRFEATQFGFTPAPGRFLAIYEVETDDIQSLMDEMRRRWAAGQIRMSDATDLASTQIWVYENANSAGS